MRVMYQICLKGRNTNIYDKGMQGNHKQRRKSLNDNSYSNGHYFICIGSTKSIFCYAYTHTANTIHILDYALLMQQLYSYVWITSQFVFKEHTILPLISRESVWHDPIKSIFSILNI